MGKFGRCPSHKDGVAFISSIRMVRREKRNIWQLLVTGMIDEKHDVAFPRDSTSTWHNQNSNPGPSVSRKDDEHGGFIVEMGGRTTLE